MKCGIAIFCFTLLAGSIDAAVRPRIIGGENAEITEFPYMASIRLNGEHICGGTIIGQNHILTTARCVTSSKEIAPPYLCVNVTTGTSSSISVGHSHSIEKITVHPNWSGIENTSILHDIAVIKLKDTIIFDECQQKVELPTCDAESGKWGILTGWGSTRQGHNEEVAIHLQKVDLSILINTDCQIGEVDSTQLCAYHPTAGRGACLGDTGGPLVVDKTIIVGILSVPNDGYCAAAFTTELYTNVFSYKEFIESQLTEY